jgi:hypothetical protein
MLLMLCLLVGIVGLVTYVVLQVRGKTPLSAQEATGIVTAALQGPGPAVIHFRTGLVNPMMKNYRTLIIDCWKKQELLNWLNRRTGACWFRSHPKESNC